MDHDLCRAVVHRDLRALVAILDGTPGLDLARRICPGRSRIRSPLEWAIEEIDPDAFAILVRYGAKAESVWDLRVQMYDLVKTGASGEGLGLDLVRLVRAVLAHEPRRHFLAGGQLEECGARERCLHIRQGLADQQRAFLPVPPHELAGAQAP